MFLVRHPVVFLFLNLFVLLECPVMSMTLIRGIKFCVTDAYTMFQGHLSIGSRAEEL